MGNLQGLGDLLDQLEGLGRNMQSEGRAIANAGAQVVKRYAVGNLREQGLVDQGYIEKNIAVKRQPDTPRGVFEYHIGVRHGAEAKNAEKIAVRGSDGKIHYEWVNNPFYWWFWEFGHYNTWEKAYIAAKPFLGPALADHQDEVLAAMVTRAKARLDKYIEAKT